MISSSDCPNCGMLYVGIKTKYLQPIQVPYYAEFQPMQRLSFCKGCGSYGTHEVEMFVKNAPLNIPQHEMWTEEQLLEYGVRARR